MSDKKFQVEILLKYCKGCGLCVQACEQEKLYMAPHRNKDGVQPACVKDDVDCTGCLKCATMCPDAAIEIYRLVAAAAGESCDE